jgi:hypothetical protein
MFPRIYSPALTLHRGELYKQRTSHAPSFRCMGFSQIQEGLEDNTHVLLRSAFSRYGPYSE